MHFSIGCDVVKLANSYHDWHAILLGHEVDFLKRFSCHPELELRLRRETYLNPEQAANNTVYRRDRQITGTTLELKIGISVHNLAKQ